MELKGGEGLSKALAEIAEKMGGGSVSIGFIDAAKYPDGTPVAAVAFWNEFGHKGIHPSPPRPFFRNMISKESPNWPLRMAALAKKLNYDGEQVLAIMGEDVKGALQQSINNLTDPALAPSTIADKGFAKPLIDTGKMIHSISYEVKK